jgi:hypothetical protein
MKAALLPNRTVTLLGVPNRCAAGRVSPHSVVPIHALQVVATLDFQKEWIRVHTLIAKQLGKPLLFQEFGRAVINATDATIASDRNPFIQVGDEAPQACTAAIWSICSFVVVVQHNMCQAGNFATRTECLIGLK